VVVLVEIFRKNFLASIVPVIVNCVLNHHHIVIDIVAFVSKGDFPRSRLGEKQRGKILAGWVTRKMRTIAQFGIRDPDAAEQLQEVPEEHPSMAQRASMNNGQGLSKQPGSQMSSGSTAVTTSRRESLMAQEKMQSMSLSDRDSHGFLAELPGRPLDIPELPAEDQRSQTGDDTPTNTRRDPAVDFPMSAPPTSNPNFHISNPSLLNFGGPLNEYSPIDPRGPFADSPVTQNSSQTAFLIDPNMTTANAIPPRVPSVEPPVPTYANKPYLQLSGFDANESHSQRPPQQYGGLYAQPAAPPPPGVPPPPPGPPQQQPPETQQGDLWSLPSQRRFSQDWYNQYDSPTDSNSSPQSSHPSATVAPLRVMNRSSLVVEPAQMWSPVEQTPQTQLQQRMGEMRRPEVGDRKKTDDSNEEWKTNALLSLSLTGVPGHYGP
jgi:hypothetical protein